MALAISRILASIEMGAAMRGAPKAGWWPFGEGDEERLQRERQEEQERRYAEIDAALAEFIDRVTAEAAAEIDVLNDRLADIDTALGAMDRDDPAYGELTRESRRVTSQIKEVERVLADRIERREDSAAKEKYLISGVV